MGYDMYAVKITRKGGAKKFDEPNYFRANSWGMGILRGAMKAAKVLDLNHKDPKWIEPENEKDWDKVNKDVVAFRSKNKNKVPIGKFCSNDGWHLVEEECILLADAIEKLLKSGKDIPYQDWFDGLVTLTDDHKKYVQEFANFCRHCGTHGGFKVW
jgi:hypothetical protein